MATLTVRNVPEAVHARLRVRAARRGRSMEAEAREILARAVAAEGEAGEDPAALQAWVRELYGGRAPGGVVDSLLEERRAEAAGE